jgi:hypothetical protein
LLPGTSTHPLGPRRLSATPRSTTTWAPPTPSAAPPPTPTATLGQFSPPPLPLRPPLLSISRLLPPPYHHTTIPPCKHTVDPEMARFPTGDQLPRLLTFVTIFLCQVLQRCARRRCHRYVRGIRPCLQRGSQGNAFEPGRAPWLLEHVRHVGAWQLGAWPCVQSSRRKAGGVLQPRGEGSITLHLLFGCTVFGGAL